MRTPVTAPVERPGFVAAVRMVFGALSRHGRTCIALGVVFALLQAVGTVIVAWAAEAASSGSSTPEEWLTVGAAAAAAVVLVALVQLLVAPPSYGALSLVGSAAVYGDVVDPHGIRSRAIERAPEAIGAVLLIVLVLAAGPAAVGFVALGVSAVFPAERGFEVLVFGMAVVAVPVVYAAVRLSLAVPVVMREGLGARDALGRSWALVAGAWWWVAAIHVVATLPAFALNAAIGAVGPIGVAGLGGFALRATAGAVTALAGIVLSALASGVIYASRAPEDLAAAATASR